MKKKTYVESNQWSNSVAQTIKEHILQCIVLNDVVYNHIILYKHRECKTQESYDKIDICLHI